MKDKLAMMMCSVFTWIWYKWDCQCYGLPFTSYADYWDFKQEEFLKAIREWLNQQPGLKAFFETLRRRRGDE